MFDAFRGKIRAIPRMRGILKSLRQRNIPICVASQRPIREMEVTLGATGLKPLLEVRIYFADAVARPKPAPDLFLRSARSEDAVPGACLMIEDSAKGDRATVAAQIRVAGYDADANGDALAEAGANTIFSDMADLPALIWETHHERRDYRDPTCEQDRVRNYRFV